LRAKGSLTHKQRMPQAALAPYRGVADTGCLSTWTLELVDIQVELVTKRVLLGPLRFFAPGRRFRPGAKLVLPGVLSPRHAGSLAQIWHQRLFLVQGYPSWSHYGAISTLLGGCRNDGCDPGKAQGHPFSPLLSTESEEYKLH